MSARAALECSADLTCQEDGPLGNNQDIVLDGAPTLNEVPTLNAGVWEDLVMDGIWEFRMDGGALPKVSSLTCVASSSAKSSGDF